MSNEYLNKLSSVAEQDVEALKRAEKSYGDSWKKRGGTGAFMMLARKWDRIENQVSKKGKIPAYDILGHAANDKRPEGLIDDIRDLRRYLLLVEAELIASGVLIPEIEKDLPLFPRDQHPSPFGFEENKDI